jgi:hypothetical protein
MQYTVAPIASCAMHFSPGAPGVCCVPALGNGNRKMNHWHLPRRRVLMILDMENDEMKEVVRAPYVELPPVDARRTIASRFNLRPGEGK